MQPTEEEAIDYTENNTSKTAKEIVTDIGDRPEAERQQSPDTQNRKRAPQTSLVTGRG
ncbi:hypothetical protein FRB93_002139 [Tulasnella sp. JGI-2019a]|nr:hypothetical protein FRB93_002139 [Tulasnella sp. JGI-2019a]